MPLEYANLDARTRRFMAAEIEIDTNAGTLYLSSYFSDVGRQDWPRLLREAAETHDDGWLATRLRENGRLNRTTQRRKPTGGFTTANVPVTAHETCAEGEFNRFYIRGLCRRAAEDGVGSLIVYRAKQVENPRPESEQLIGTAIDVTRVLADLRDNPGVETALGLARPNSGLTLRLP